MMANRRPMALLAVIFASLSSMAGLTNAGEHDPTQFTSDDRNRTMTDQETASQDIRLVIDNLIQTATSYDVDALDVIYHEDLHVLMIDNNDNLNTADKDAFKSLFQSKRDAGDPPMNTWAKYHHIDVDGDKAHVLLSRKNNLSGQDMALTLSIDLIHEDDRWQVTREIIFLRPDTESS